VEQSAFNPANVVPGTTGTARCAWTAITAPPPDTSRTARASGRSNRITDEPRLSVEGAADHWNHRDDADYYSQPAALFRLMSAGQRQALFENTARAIGVAPREIQLRHIANCMRADRACGEGVAKALGISGSELR
jgi:catalase